MNGVSLGTTDLLKYKVKTWPVDMKGCFEFDFRKVEKVFFRKTVSLAYSGKDVIHIWVID